MDLFTLFHCVFEAFNLYFDFIRVQTLFVNLTFFLFILNFLFILLSNHHSPSLPFSSSPLKLPNTVQSSERSRPPKTFSQKEVLSIIYIMIIRELGKILKQFNISVIFSYFCLLFCISSPSCLQWTGKYHNISHLPFTLSPCWSQLLLKWSKWDHLHFILKLFFSKISSAVISVVSYCPLHLDWTENLCYQSVTQIIYKLILSCFSVLGVCFIVLRVFKSTYIVLPPQENKFSTAMQDS